MIIMISIRKKTPLAYMLFEILLGLKITAAFFPFLPTPPTSENQIVNGVIDELFNNDIHATKSVLNGRIGQHDNFHKKVSEVIPNQIEAHCLACLGLC